MKVVLISGKARHGKDTVASFIKDKLNCDGKTVLITHYADLLKFICKNYFGWNGEKDEVGRKLLQYVGTDVVRKQNPSLWVDFVIMMLEYFGQNWDYVVIPDCRFPNEITQIKDKFKSVVHLRVIRPNLKTTLTKEQQCHPSETALDGFPADDYIHNDSSLKMLRQKVNSWCDVVLYKEKIWRN